MKKEVNAARDAPLWRMEMAAGSTPQEHNGKGMPTAADFITDRQPVPAKWRANVFWGTKACISPAMKNPSKMYGDISLSMNNNEFNNSIF